MSSFVSQLKQRRVYRVAIGYAIAAWLAVQVGATVLPAFHASEVVLPVLIVLLGLGFPVALVLAWAFDVTPAGIEKMADATPTAAAKNLRYAWVLAAIGSAIAALGVGAYWLWHYPKAKRFAAPAIESQSVATDKTTAPDRTAPDKSIAVLPFDNLSHDPENAYFAEGIQDEILTRLAKIAELKVISRTSTQRFKSAPGDLRQIAQQLGVAHILEGSVQKTADQVRVNVQLINASTDAHLWADTFDRKLTDIFAVESEIAKSVAETLQARLTGSAERVLASRPTEDPEAHQLYLKGRFFWNKRAAANLRKAIDYFEQAVAKDPSYALAYSGLADARSLLPQYDVIPPREEVGKALVAARKAVALDDGLSEAHTSLGNALASHLELAAAGLEFQRAIALNPNYATAHQWYGEFLQSGGRFDEAVVELKRAQELDPLSAIINASLGSTLVSARRYNEAIEQLHKTTELDPSLAITHEFLAEAFEGQGDLPRAIAEYETAARLDPYFGTVPLGYAYAVSGRTEEARKILDQMTQFSKQHYVPAWAFALIYAGLGKKDQAISSLEKSYLEGDSNMGGLARARKLDSLRGDPRFEALVQKVQAGAAVPTAP